ncbi:hypothetical protein [Devosia naphthalenivorans]|uniref:hypothetical protein n=1 Tax=Devosia naphthalenivorans TaxID=2082392 RepID=UPI000D3B0044|nr:hypothetical protein [Devosia naphthalenivorans]
MRTLVVMAVLVTFSLPGVAQSFPAGSYLCTDANGIELGTMAVLKSGEYQLKSSTMESGEGHLGPYGSVVKPTGGPLATIQSSGTHKTDVDRRTVFEFTSEYGRIRCAAAQ